MKEFWAFALHDILRLRRFGCTPQQIDRLVELRQRVRDGAVSELTLDTRRIRFVRGLIQHGRLSEAVLADSTSSPTPR
ncbi:MAG TPA: hypothetical protein VMW62_03935 [Chloroflexota bacterium]|nr:hypothetical protein [Chloroflexota bacterium]